jgi:5'-nucleotidase/UDP-sugar diphosphatase
MSDVVRLRIVCVGDVYSERPIRGRGGYAELARVIARERASAEHCLVLGLGDLLGGSGLCELTHGKHVIELMNAIRFDASAVGNHEFDHAPGESTLAQRVAESRFAWLAANVALVNGTVGAIPGVLPFVVRELGGVRVGLLGLCTAHTPVLSYPSEKVRFESVVDAARRAVDALRGDEHRCDLVVALTHQTFFEDKSLVKQVRGIDLVLGGHDHDAIAAVVAEPSRLGDTLIFKPGMNAYWCGVIDIQVRRHALAHYRTLATVVDEDLPLGFVSYRNEAVALLDSSTPCAEADACTAIIERYEAERHAIEAAAAATVLIPALPAPLNALTKAVRTREASSGNLLADSMLAWTPGTQLGLINGGFIRNDKQYAAGATITQADVLEMLPFARPIVLMDIRGADLRRGIEQMLVHTPAASGAFPQLSRGIELRYNPLAPPMSKVVSLSLNGEPVEDERLYRVATSKFLRGGGDNCSAFTEGTTVESHEVRIAKAMSQYLAKHGNSTVIPGDPEGRIVAVE